MDYRVPQEQNYGTTQCHALRQLSCSSFEVSYKIAALIHVDTDVFSPFKEEEGMTKNFNLQTRGRELMSVRQKMSINERE